MLIQVISDLHLEHGNVFPEISGDADIVVLAGDIGLLDEVLESFLEYLNEHDLPVLYVAGNHEYYGFKGGIREGNVWLENISYKYKNIHFLNDGAFLYCKDHDEVKFTGSTLWTNFGNNPMEEIRAFSGVNDFRAIERSSPNDYIVRNQNAVNYIEKSIDKQFKNVVITHWPPMRELHDYNKFPSVSYYFNNDLSDLFAKKGKDISAWIYGHNHHSENKVVKGVRCFSNQVCYPKENGFLTKIVPVLLEV